MLLALREVVTTLRILHVLDSRQLRGAEMFASDLIRALNTTSVSQRVAVLQDLEGPGVHFDTPVHLLGSDGWMAPGLRIRPRALRGLRRLINRWRPDIAQAHGGSTLKYTIPAVGTQRTRVVYRQIGPTPRAIAGPIKRAGHGLLMRRADAIVAVGEAVRRNLVEMFRVPAEHVVTIPNAVDPRRMRLTRDRESFRQELGIPPSSPVLLSLGALTWEKDPLAHLDIAARVLTRRPDAIHLLVGDGPMRGEVEAAIRRLGLEKRQWLMGARSDVANFYAASDLLLFASRPYGMESMNASVIEAGMLGVPAAAYAVGGVPEVVLDGVTGCLTPAGDADGLAERVLELIGDPEATRTMGEAARERYRSKYDIRGIAPKYLELYEELVGS
jgi:glycosyltransferase involved in cell wall biosynthesis